MKNIFYYILASIIDFVIWLTKPRIIRVDRETAEHFTKFGGARVVGKLKK